MLSFQSKPRFRVIVPKSSVSFGWTSFKPTATGAYPFSDTPTEIIPGEISTLASPFHGLPDLPDPLR